MFFVIEMIVLMDRAVRCTKAPIYAKSENGAALPCFYTRGPTISRTCTGAVELPLGSVREFMFYNFMTSKVRIAQNLYTHFSMSYLVQYETIKRVQSEIVIN